MAADLDALVERAQGLGLTGRTTIMRALNLTDWKAARVVDAIKARRAAAASEDEPSGFPGRLAELLTGSPRTVEDLANALDCSPARVRAGLNDLNAAGHPIQERGPDAFVRETNPAPAHTPTELPPPDDRGVIRIGFVSDTHLGSMQQQLTHLRDAYRRMSDLGITTVYHVGDVLAGVNVYRGQHNELFLHSYDEQIAYAVEAYPRTPGIVTKAIAGNHDLRSLKDGGADPVKVWAMQRPDVEYLGPYSAWATAGDFSIYLLHPDGGGSYAVSYKLQKLVESFLGGYKPHIAMVGHWHQAVRLRTRGVKAYMPGCFEAQTEFERRRMLQPQLGALALELRMNDAGSVHQITEHWIEDFVPLERDWK